MSRFEFNAEDNKVQQPVEQSAFEKIYRSKVTRSLALIASLSFLGQFAYQEFHRGEHPSSEIEAAEKVLNIGDLSKNMAMYAPVEGSQYVVSIGQVHSDIMQVATVNGFNKDSEHGVKDLIDNQKDIETLIDRFAERDDVHTVYLENTPSAWGINILRNAKGEIERAGKGHGKLVAIKELFDYKSQSLKNSDCERAPLLYLLLQQLKNIDVKNLSADDLSEKNKMEIALTNNPLIAGDNVYIWGGAMKAFIEGKVDIRIADDEHAYDKVIQGYKPAEKDEEYLEERLRASHIKGEQLLKESEFVAEGAAENNVREDAAIAIISRDAAQHKQKFYPVIFGVAHEFTDNVQKYNKNNHTDLGLINIYEKPD